MAVLKIKDSNGNWIDVPYITPNMPTKVSNEQITNCLKEVPQRIKYTLEGGTLTIKAGTQVIVPNGFESDGVTPKFEHFTLETDRVEDSDFGYDSKRILCYMPNTTVFYNPQIEICISSATAPTPTIYRYTLWYDTTNNKIKWSGDYGANWTSDTISFPLLTGYMSGTTVWTSIDEVFNGIGYFGSTIFIDKGVKGLIPNGRNTDGTLNNIEKTTDKVSTIYCGNGTNPYFLMSNLNGLFRNALKSSHYEQAQRPVPTDNYATWYNPIENKLYFYNVGVWVEADYAIIGETTTTNGVVTSMRSKQPFRALDYNDKQEIISWTLPDYSAGVSIADSSRTYTAPKDGIVVFNIYGGTVGYLVLYVNDILFVDSKRNESGGYEKCFTVHVTKNDVLTWTCDGDNDIRYFPLKGAI